MDIVRAQSSKKGEYVARSKSVSWGAARWLTWATDHVTKSDRHNWHADQYKLRGDDASQCKLRGDVDRQLVWLGSLELQFVIKGAVVRLNWDLSSVVAK